MNKGKIIAAVSIVAAITVATQGEDFYKVQRDQAYIYCRDNGVAADCYEWSSSPMLKAWFDEGKTFDEFINE